MPMTTTDAQGVFVDGSAPINEVPTAQTIHVTKGTDNTIRVTVVNSAGLPVDLTDAACTLALKVFEDDAQPLLQRLGTVVDALNGIVEFELGSNDTIIIGAGNFVWDVEVTFPSTILAQVIPVSTFVVDPSVNNPSLQPTIQLPSFQGQGNKLLGVNPAGNGWLFRNVNGTFNARPAWVSGLAWSANDVTTFGGSTFLCIATINPSNTSPDMDPAHFQLWASKGDAGPAPAGGSDGDVIRRQAGVPAWASAVGLTQTLLGDVALTANNAWVEVLRFTPGVNKQGFLEFTARGTTSKSSKLSIWDQLSLRTDGLGRVFLQSCALAPLGGSAPTWNGAGVPAKPTGIGVNIGTPGQVTFSYTPHGETSAVFAQVSTDGGGTWTRIMGFFQIHPMGSPFVVPVDNGAIPGNTDVKFKVTAANDFGETDSDPVDIHTPNAGAPQEPGFLPTAPWFPIRDVSYSDLFPGWDHLIPFPTGGESLLLTITPALPIGGGAVETDLVVKARTATGAYVGGLVARAALAFGRTV